MSATVQQRTTVARKSTQTPGRYTIAGKDFDRKWHLVDAAGKVLGRMAEKLAVVLMGKHRAHYTPHVDTGDFVVVVNADKVKVSGRKMERKVYDHYTYYPGGYRTEMMSTLFARKPELIVKLAVRRMLPKNKLGRVMLTKLKIYKGPNHPHQAQMPTELKV
jgi:large subunit ribosomal protein L13